MLHRSVVCLAIGFWVLPVTGLGQEPAQLPSPPPLPEIVMPPVAGMPFEEAQAIVDRHREELKKIHGVGGVAVGREAMLVIVWTDEAEQAVPKMIEGLPVQVIRENVLPAPPGVVILRPGGVQEAADACPEGLKEIERRDWRFCIDPDRPEPLPPLIIEPPVAGIPREKAREILERHRAALMQLPGAEGGVWLDDQGIVVSTTQPEAVPTEPIEGLPVRAEPYKGPAQGLAHTQTTRIRPIHGGVAIKAPPLLPGTLTGIGISQGEPWYLFPTHLMPQSACASNSPCPPAGFGQSPPLNQCPHQMQPPSVGITQAPLSAPEQVGFSVRWGKLQSKFLGTSLDVAAAFMDNDTLEDNGSLFCNRRLEIFGNFTGMETPPLTGMNVTVVTQNAPHILPATITAIGQFKQNVAMACAGGLLTNLGNQIFVRSNGRAFKSGDSGAPILETATGDIVGMMNWADNMGNSINGGGTTAFDVRTRMGFDTWYGTQTSGFELRCN